MNITEWAQQFLDGPGYEWGGADVGPVAEFRRAMEQAMDAGGTIDEIVARVMDWAAADFERAYQAFCTERQLLWGVTSTEFQG